MANNGGGQLVHGACAACKHLRKRCDESCIVAPHFPTERTEEFEIVHERYGIKNVIGMLKSVDENERDKTVETLIVEAEIRQQNPVQGCLGYERRLRVEVEKLTLELNQVHHQLQLFRDMYGALPSERDDTSQQATPK